MSRVLPSRNRSAYSVLCFSSCHTKTVLEIVDGFFHLYSDFINGISFFCFTGCFWISTKILLKINVYHPSAGRCRAWIVAMADTMGFLYKLILFLLHFGTNKFRDWKSTAQMRFTAFPFHGKEKVFRATGNTIRINGIIASLNYKFVFQASCEFPRVLKKRNEVQVNLGITSNDNLLLIKPEIS